MNKLIGLLAILILANCSDSAHVTWDTEIYDKEFSIQDENKTSIGTLKKGDIVTALDYRWHGWSVRDSIKIQTKDGKVGWISPRAAVIGQDPEKSVYTWGHRKDYKYFYDPNDKEHFPKGFEHPAVKNLSKEKIPFEKIAKKISKTEE